MEKNINKPINNFVLLGGMADFDRADGDCLLKADQGDSVVWTAHKRMKENDRAFFYICAPISAIVASGTVVGNIWINTDTRSRWQNYPMAEIGGIDLLEESKRIKISNLRGLFPEWSWLRYPRANCEIPKDFAPAFIELYGQKILTGVFTEVKKTAKSGVR